MLATDALAARWRLPRFRRHHRALVSEGAVHGEEIVLLKPQTYMNLSGEALRPLLDREGWAVERELLVLVDDLALPLGTFRIRARGSAGGHNGLASVEGALGTRNYARLRIGIGPLPPTVDDQADWVLAPWTRAERETILELLPRVCEAVECWLTQGVETAMNRFNRRGTERD